MSAGYNLADKGRLQIRVFDKIRRDVSLDMVHRHQRLLCRPGDGLRLRRTDQEGTHKSRSVGNRNGGNLVKGHMGIREGCLYHIVDVFNVPARGDLRHHAAEQGMLGNLRGDDIREHLSPVLHNRSRRLIAGALDCENIYILSAFAGRVFLFRPDFHNHHFPSVSSNIRSTDHPSFAAFACGKIRRTSFIKSSGYIRDGL